MEAKWDGDKTTENTGSVYELPNGWSGVDLCNAAAEMEQFTRTTAFKLFAHRMGLEQGKQLARAIPTSFPQDNERKCYGAGAYYALAHVFTMIGEIAEYQPPREGEDEQ